MHEQPPLARSIVHAKDEVTGPSRRVGHSKAHSQALYEGCLACAIVATQQDEQGGECWIRRGRAQPPAELAGLFSTLRLDIQRPSAAHSSNTTSCREKTGPSL